MNPYIQFFRCLQFWCLQLFIMEPKKKKMYSVLLSLCYNNNRKNLLWCYTMQFTKYLCTYYGHLSSQAISSLSDSLWLTVTLHNSNEYWMKYSRYVLKRTTYPDCFCSLDSQMATLTQIMLPCQRLPLPTAKVNEQGADQLLHMPALDLCLLPLPFHMTTDSAVTNAAVQSLYTSYLDSNSFSDVLAKKIQKVLFNSQTLNHLTILCWLENNIIGEILLRAKLNTFTVLYQKLLHSMVVENCSEPFKTSLQKISSCLSPPRSLLPAAKFQRLFSLCSPSLFQGLEKTKTVRDNSNTSV